MNLLIKKALAKISHIKKALFERAVWALRSLTSALKPLLKTVWENFLFYLEILCFVCLFLGGERAIHFLTDFLNIDNFLVTKSILVIQFLLGIHTIIKIADRIFEADTLNLLRKFVSYLFSKM